MGARTKEGILKLVTIVVGLVATGVGCAAHFLYTAKSVWDEPGSKEECMLQFDNCPKFVISMEWFFVGVTIVCLILSVVSLVAGLLMDLTSPRIVDGGYHIVGGILVVLAGIGMIASAVQIDNFLTGQLNGTHPFKDALVNEIRKQTMYPHKLAAGAVAIINGIIYFATAGVIFEGK